VAFRLGGTVVPVELFDLRLNRPDLVLARFGYAPQRGARRCTRRRTTSG
jgi:hypothetical protein